MTPVFSHCRGLLDLFKDSLNSAVMGRLDSSENSYSRRSNWFVDKEEKDRRVVQKEENRRVDEGALKE